MRCGRARASGPARPPTATSPSRGSSTSCSRRASARSRRPGSTVYLRPETAQGIFVNFKNVAQLARRKPPFGIAQVGKAFRNEITPGNFIFRTLEFEQMEMEFFVPPAEADEWFRYWIAERLAWYTRYGIRDQKPPRPRARRRRALALLERHERHRVPLPHRLVGARGDREPRRLRPHRAHGGLGDEARMGRRRQRRAVHPAVIEPALGVNRSMLAFLCDAYDEEVVAERERTVLRLHPALAPVKAAVLPLVPQDTAMVETARALHEELRRVMVVEYDDGGADRPPVPPPGRDRHPVGADDRRADLESTTPSRCATATRSPRSGSPIAAPASHLLDRLHAPWSPPPRAATGAARGGRIRRYTQSHMATTPLFTPALASLGGSRPARRTSSPRRARAARARHRRPAGAVGAARPRDPDRRRYELLYEDERMDAWVLSWMPGQGTGFHDHYISGVGIAVAAGGVREDLMVYGRDDVALHLRAGDTRQGGPGYIHRVRHEDGRARRDDPRLLAAARLGRPVPPRRRRASSAARCARAGTSSPSSSSPRARSTRPRAVLTTAVGIPRAESCRSIPACGGAPRKASPSAGAATDSNSVVG